MRITLLRRLLGLLTGPVNAADLCEMFVSAKTLARIRTM